VPSRSFARPLALTVTATLCLAAMPILPPTADAAPRSHDSVVIQWDQAVLEAVRSSKLGPPMVSRALAIVATCQFDAWAAYDRKAVGTLLGGSLRRPPNERTLTNKKEAISFGAYRAAVDLFPASKAIFDSLMHNLGYDPSNTSTDTITPAGIGNVACEAVLDFRHRDGANQLGDEPGGSPGVPYSDYTGYVAVNDPMDLTVPFDPATVHDPNHWQPLRFNDAGGNTVTQTFLAPFWNRVVPFALTSDDQFRSPSGPATFETQPYADQAHAVLDLSAGLSDKQKSISEYWADGPSSETPPGHWHLFAEYVARRDHHGNNERGVDLDVKMFFALSNAIFDAGICSWDNKRAFDSVRPITAIRTLFDGQPVLAWGGPFQGTRLIDGAAWLPYQPSTFPTPPFAEYGSGHSTFSAAGAEILALFTRSPRFGLSVVVSAGSSKIEPGFTPAADIVLTWPTFSAAADEAGLSRRYGGIHFEQGDLDAREVGRQLADLAWKKALTYFDGSTAD
jgi:hypothetical protein